MNFSLRDSIATNPTNWENCAMYVQDIKSPGINIAAEISHVETNNFKTICKVISSEKLHGHFIDEYMSKLSTVQSLVQSAGPFKGSYSSLNSMTPTSSESSNSTTFSMQNLKTAINSMENVLENSTSKKIENLIKTDDVSKAAVVEMRKLLTRSEQRIQNEANIIEMLTRFFQTVDSTLKVVPFGSSTYGFGGSRTNFNILLKTNSSKALFLIFNIFLSCFNLMFS